MSHYHAVVWLDHRSAHVLHLGHDDVAALHVHAKGSGHMLEHAKHIHHRAGTRTGNHAPDNPTYFNDVVAALGDAHDWLIVGPGTAKQDFMRHLRDHRPELVERIVGIESADHPTDKQIVANARRYFLGSDRLRPPLGA
jgi:stalled ribosome rescue protein Dom34